MNTPYTVPGVSSEDSQKAISALQGRLSAYNDLHLTLKHVHWNVVGPHFIAVHEMIDPQVELVRGYADDVAERIATMGGEPKGTVNAIQNDREWDDYSINRDTVLAHLGALNMVYDGLISTNRKVIETLAEIDPICEDMIIAQTAELELFQWFVRAHLESTSGELSSASAGSETEAADAARTDG